MSEKKNSFKTELIFDNSQALKAAREFQEAVQGVEKASDKVKKAGEKFDGFSADLNKAKKVIKEANENLEEQAVKLEKVVKSSEKVQKVQAKQTDNTKKENKILKETNKIYDVSAAKVKTIRAGKLALATVTNLLSGNIFKAVKSFRLLAVAMNATPVGLATTLIGGLTAAYAYYQQNLSASARLEKRFQETLKETNKIASKTEKLYNKINNSLVSRKTLTVEARKLELEQLRAEKDLLSEENEKIKNKIQAEQSKLIDKTVERASKTRFGQGGVFNLLNLLNSQADKLESESFSKTAERYKEVKDKIVEIESLLGDLNNEDSEYLFNVAVSLPKDSEASLNQAKSYLERAKQFVGFNSDLANKIEKELDAVEGRLEKIYKKTDNRTLLERIRDLIAAKYKELDKAIIGGDFERADQLIQEIRKRKAELKAYENSIEEYYNRIDNLRQNQPTGKLKSQVLPLVIDTPESAQLPDFEKVIDEAFQKLLNGREDYYNDLRELQISNAKLTITNEEKLNKEITLINLLADKAILQSKLANKNFIQGASFEQIQAIKNQIKLLDNEIEKLGGTADKTFDVIEGIRNGLAETLGISRKEFDAIEDAFASMVSIAQSLASELKNSRLEALDDELDAIRERKDEIENSINEEYELYKLGQANSYELMKSSLEEQRELEKKHLAEKAAIQKENAEIEFLAGTLSQGTQLLTASANLYAAMSPLGVAGVVGAGVLITGMLAAFAKVKAEVYKNLNEGGSLAEHISDRERTGEVRTGGRVTQHGAGRTDKHGMRGYRIQGTNIVVGGDEFIVNSKATNEHIGFLHKLNKGVYNGVNFDEILLHHFSPKAHNEVFHQAEEERITIINNKTFSKDDLRKVLKEELTDMMEGFFHYDKSKEMKVGNTIKKGSTTRTFLN